MPGFSRLQLFQTLPSFTSSMGKGRLGRILDRHIWNNPGLTSGGGNYLPYILRNNNRYNVYAGRSSSESSSGSASTASRFTFKFNAPSKVPEKWKRPEPQIPAWTAQKTQHDLAEKLNKEIRAIHKAVPETTLQEHNEELRKAAAGISELELEQMLALRGQLDDIKDTFGPLASPASLDMRNEVLRNVKILEQQADQRRSLVREMLKQAEGSSGGGIHQSRWGKIKQAHTQQDRQRDALAKIRKGLEQGKSVDTLDAYLENAIKAHTVSHRKLNKATYAPVRYSGTTLVETHPLGNARPSKYATLPYVNPVYATPAYTNPVYVAPVYSNYSNPVGWGGIGYGGIAGLTAINFAAGFALGSIFW
jgi:hypothetical protein